MKINGTEKQYPDGITISEMLKREGFQKEQVAVERNEEIVAKDDYGTMMLLESDVVEVVTFMGGGAR